MGCELDKIKKICVVGAGVMGSGIAQVFAQNGIEVILVDMNDEIIKKSIESLKLFLDGSIKRGKVTKDQKRLILSRIKGTSDIKKSASNADVVIEAIIEDMTIKKNLFSKLDKICPDRTILGSNTSALSITEIASATKRPEKVIGMHWGNPPQIMKGIEVVRTEKTSQQVVDIIVGLSKKIGKLSIVCKDSPGFVSTRIMPPWRNECMRLYDEGVASMEDIDKAFRVAFGVPMGPFELTDLTGLDVSLSVQNTLYKEFGREIFRPAQCLIMKVKAGDLGRKSGQGFYKHKQNK